MRVCAQRNVYVINVGLVFWLQKESKVESQIGSRNVPEFPTSIVAYEAFSTSTTAYEA